eukprot:TRINITY_DN2125_c0_g1_i1.p1 TRINITY_DN2125_c0_g1~~TRINITY_DN2125_c0_g1_i1.p1  ORF type:complete len:483 (+),score=143.67 TRINITY_DN2125_c0_g1_i1:39-1487(+)
MASGFEGHLQPIEEILNELNIKFLDEKNWIESQNFETKLLSSNILEINLKESFYTYLNHCVGEEYSIFQIPYLQGCICGFLSNIIEIKTKEDTINVSVNILRVMKSIIYNIFSTINNFGKKYINSTEKCSDIEYLINFLKKEFKNLYSLKDVDFILDELIEKSIEGKPFEEDLMILNESIDTLIEKASVGDYIFSCLNEIGKWEQSVRTRLAFTELSKETIAYFKNSLVIIDILCEYFSNSSLLLSHSNRINILEEFSKYEIELPCNLSEELPNSCSVYQIPSIIGEIIEFSNQLPEVSESLNELEGDNVLMVNPFLIDLGLHAYATLKFIEASKVLCKLYNDPKIKDTLPGQFEIFQNYCIRSLSSVYAPDSELMQNYYNLFKKNSINNDLLNKVAKDFEVAENAFQLLTGDVQHMDEYDEKGDLAGLVHLENILGEEIVMECLEHVVSGGKRSDLTFEFQDQEENDAFNELLEILKSFEE